MAVGCALNELADPCWEEMAWPLEPALLRRSSAAWRAALGKSVSNEHRKPKGGGS